jgi:hypothetical protein
MDDKTTPEEEEFIEGFEEKEIQASSTKKDKPRITESPFDDKANEESEDEYIDWDN